MRKVYAAAAFATFLGLSTDTIAIEAIEESNSSTAGFSVESDTSSVAGADDLAEGYRFWEGGLADYRSGALESAALEFKRAFEIFAAHELRGDGHVDTANAANAVALVMDRLGRTEETVRWGDRALAILRGLEQESDVAGQVFDLDALLARELLALGRLPEAERYAMRALSVVENTDEWDVDHPDALAVAVTLADVYGAQGRHADLVALYEPILKRLSGVTDPVLESIRIRVTGGLVAAYHAVGRNQDAERLAGCGKTGSGQVDPGRGRRLPRWRALRLAGSGAP